MKETFTPIIESVINAIQIRLLSIIEWAPSVFMAVLLFFFGLILAELASRAIIGASEKLRLDYISDKIGLKHFFGTFWF